MLEVNKSQVAEDVLAHYASFTAPDLIREITFVHADSAKSSERAKYPTRAHAELVKELWTQLVYGNKYFEVSDSFFFFLSFSFSSFPVFFFGFKLTLLFAGFSVQPHCFPVSKPESGGSRHLPPPWPHSLQGPL